MNKAVLPSRHRVDVDEYHRMAEAGLLGEYQRVELIDGDLIAMAPTGQGHAATVSRLTRDLVLDAYRTPAADGYTQTSTHQPGDRLALVLAPDIVVQLELLFSERR
jgi:Uma2 family endonuclease